MIKRAHISDWCVLRMASARTLAVVRSLREAGFDVWTPTGMTRRYRPRSTKYRDEDDALVKTFAFARYQDAPRLSALAHAPGQEHPAFTLLMHRERYGRVTDRALDGLREHEVDHAEKWKEFVAAEELKRLERLRKKKGRKTGSGRLNSARSYVLGQRVRVTAPAFQGLTGQVVENKRNGDLVITFDGLALELTVEACDLKPVHVREAKPEQAPTT